MKLSTYTLIFLFKINFVIAQSITSTATEELEVICKAWGLIKYHHPVVQTGKYDLDNLLLRSLEDSDNGKPVNKIIKTWLTTINSSTITNIANNKKMPMTDSHKWIFDTPTLDNSLKDELNNLTKSITNRKFYVKTSKIGNVEVINEKQYSLDKVVNKHIRLLILFKYWNIIEYFYPYKELIHTDWDNILRRYIPMFISATSDLEFQLTFLKLTVEISDSHGNYFTPDIIKFYGEKYIPSHFKIIDDKVVISDHYNQALATKNNLHLGDIIFQVNGVSVKERMKYLEEYTPGSNSSRKKYNYRYSLLNGNEDSVTLGIVRDLDTIQQKVGRINIQDFDIPLYKPKWEMMDNDILYVRTWEISGKEIKALKKEMMKSKAVIIDLRKYPKFSVGERLTAIIKDKKSIFFKRRVPNLKQPGNFISLDGRVSGPKGKFQYRENIAVLVDEKTLSFGEFIVMDLQSCKNVTVVGSQTAGAVGFMSTFNVVDDYSTTFTGTGIYYPDHTNVHRNGNKIDHEIQVSIDGLRKNKDEILNAAVILLKSKIQQQNDN